MRLSLINFSWLGFSKLLRSAIAMELHFDFLTSLSTFCKVFFSERFKNLTFCLYAFIYFNN
jgi:hypothetical protein